MNLPRHLAIIMDGNGRWARARGHNRFYGHVRGAKVAKQIINECCALKIPYLTLFAFSSENWFRPDDEVSFLMFLLRRQLQREAANFKEKNIRFRSIGDISRLPREAQKIVNETIESTAQNTGMTLSFALSYGGRQEITDVVRDIASLVATGDLAVSEIDEALVAKSLPSSFLPDPDLLIRTSGEARLSNFMLWQSAYSEIEFETKPWPEFSPADLHRILAKYASRERRFGRTSEQLRLT